jgi:hypothetical protein
LFGEGWDDNVGGLLRISCSAIRARHEERRDEGSLVSLNNSKPRWKLGKLSSFGKSPMVRIFGQNDAFRVILWNIFGFRMMRGARFYGDNFGEQMKNNNGGGGTGIQLNRKRITGSNRFLLEIFILIVTSWRART